MAAIKNKAKTKSEDIIEENSFLTAMKEQKEKLQLTQTCSDSNVSTNVSKELACEKPVSKPPSKKKKKNPLLDFQELDMIGCGSFGRVVKVQKKSNGSQYAMKVIEKKKVEKVGSTHFNSNVPF